VPFIAVFLAHMLGRAQAAAEAEKRAREGMTARNEERQDQEKLSRQQARRHVLLRDIALEEQLIENITFWSAQLLTLSEQQVLGLAQAHELFRVSINCKVVAPFATSSLIDAMTEHMKYCTATAIASRGSESLKRVNAVVTQIVVHHQVHRDELDNLCRI